MPIRGASPITFRATGVCDAIDGSNAPEGAMRSLQNLIPHPKNAQQFVPRPASVQITNFAGFTSPAAVNALIVIGSRAYGMVASSTYPGKDEPFCYDLAAGAFVAITGQAAANLPDSPAASGDWEPPTMAMIANRLMITHPGYTGSNKVGWIDMRAFASTTLTATTTTGSPTLTVVSASPIIAGASPGDVVTGAGIQANSRIVSMTATTITLDKNASANAAGVALNISGGTKAAPRYGAGTTNTNTLVARPKAVAGFNGRAYYAVNNGLQFTDALKPLEITNATQALTLGDDADVTALAPLPLGSQVVGGIVQSLIAFKGAAPYWQITGDSATSDLRVDQVAGSVGTLAPLTIQPTVAGLAYISPNGLRVLDPATGRAGEPIGANGMGVTAPFAYAVAPSRMCAAFSKNVYRVSVQNGDADGQPTQEWWYHFSLGAFTGPHSFPAAVIARCDNGETDFILAASGIDGKLWESTISPSASSTYTENSAAISLMWTPTLSPDNGTGNSNQLVQSSVGLSLPATSTLTFQATSDVGDILDTITLAGDGDAAAIWGSFTWGSGTWGGGVASFRQYTLPWSKPLVFKQASIGLYGPAVSGLVIGNVIAGVQPTGYQGAFG